MFCFFFLSHLLPAIATARARLPWERDNSNGLFLKLYLALNNKLQNTILDESSLQKLNQCCRKRTLKLTVTSLTKIQFLPCCSFIEKTSVKQSMKCKVCSNFQMQMYPPVEASGGQEQYYIRSSWHVEECNCQCSGQSDVPPSRGIWWPRAVLHKVRSTLHFFVHFMFRSDRGKS